MHAFLRASAALALGLRASAALALGFAAPAAAETYFVSPSGSDAGPGTAAAPWQTLQHAADVVGPGDVVIALPGAYDGFNLFTSGAPGAPITFTAAPGAPAANPAVVIDGNNPFTGQDRINLEGASHVVIEGFTVLGQGDPAENRAGIRAVGFADDPARFVTIRANRCDRNGRWGIFTGHVDDLLIEDNECSRAADEHGIYASNSGDRPVIRRNVVWGNHSNGIHLNGDLSQGGDGVISQALIERNVIFENGDGDPIFGPPGGSAINCDGVVDARIQNNLLYQNHKSGISLYRIDGGAPSTGNRVIANTIHNAADARFALNIKDASTGNVVANNVLLNDHPTRGSLDTTSDCLPGLVCDSNVVEASFGLDDAFLSLAEWQAATGQDLHSFLSTPAATFADAAAADYQLAPSSGAKDSAIAALSPPDDLLGKPRPAGPGFDRGAYELGACFGAVAAYGAGSAGSGGFTPTLAPSGCPDAGETFRVDLAQGLGGAPALLALGVQAIAVPFQGGTIHVLPLALVPATLSGPAGAPGQGAATFAFGVAPDPGFLGRTATMQAFVVDAGSGGLGAFSAALAVTVDGSG